jgi:4-diphosphocytidyl-2C-methyl-D-erythritol kinase
MPKKKHDRNAMMITKDQPTYYTRCRRVSLPPIESAPSVPSIAGIGGGSSEGAGMMERRGDENDTASAVPKRH